MARQKVCVFLCVDIIGHYRNVVVAAHCKTQAAQQCGFAGTYRTADADTQGLLRMSCCFACRHSGSPQAPQERNKRVYWVSCLMLAMASAGRLLPSCVSSSVAAWRKASGIAACKVIN